MKIQPSGQCDLCFGARASRENLQRVVTRAKSTVAGVPRLYTMLDYLDKYVSGKEVKFVKQRANHGYKITGPQYEYDYLLKVNDDVIGVGHTDFFEALIDACVESGNKQYGSQIRMPRSVFENQWWSNLQKTILDVYKFALKK